MPNMHNAGVQTNNPIIKTPSHTDKTYGAKLHGITATTFNAAMLQTVAFKRVMAGTEIENLNIKGEIRMLTPVVPISSPITATFRAFKVPNSRIWNEAEAYSAQKKNAPTEEPFITAFDLINSTTTTTINPTDSREYRESIAGMYYPRIATGETNFTAPQIELMQEIKMSALPLRGYKAITNDFTIIKDFETKAQEYNSTVVNETEKLGYIPQYQYLIQPTQTTLAGRGIKNMASKCRGSKRENYYTNYRSELNNTTNIGANAGFTDPYNENNQTLQYHTEWQKIIAEKREIAENANKNDWEIVAEIRGARKVEDGKIQILGTKEIGINFTQVSQTAYNDSEITDENFQSLGTTGAYSYTQYDIDIVNYEEIKEDSFIHVLVQISVDTAYAGGINRELLNVSAQDMYRPEFKELKDDTMKSIELNTSTQSLARKNEGFKRRYNEMFTMPSHISGDFISTGVTDSNTKNPIASEAHWIGAYEKAWIKDKTGIEIEMLKFKDYSDEVINRSMALKMDLYAFDNAYVTSPWQKNLSYYIEGKNQFKLIAETTMKANLPIPEEIRSNRKYQGEV